MLKVSNLVKSFQTEYGGVQAVKDISFEVKRGEFYTLLGPSGCGKSTTLRCVAGLEKPERGEIQIGDKIVASVNKKFYLPPEQRDIGMVFQSYAIWPHMDVFNNVAYPLQVRKNKIRKKEIQARVERVLKMVELNSLIRRPAPQLSGGQQQRVALARALVGDPQLLLMDEPLSNLDARLRAEMRTEVKELVKRTGVTTLYVTHDQQEALSMSDKIGIMHEGRIVQENTPLEIYRSPKDTFTAGFLGQANFFKGEVADVAGFQLLSKVTTAHGAINCNLPEGVKKGDKVIIAVRPENFYLLDSPSDKEMNVVNGRVERTVFLGDFLECRIRVGADLINVRLHPSSNIGEGTQVYLQVRPELCTIMPA